jgi:hypothetical protein
MSTPVYIAAVEHDRASRLALWLAGIGFSLPFMVLALKPGEYGLILPARPPLLSQLLALRLSQALFWLALPINATAALVSGWHQLHRRRFSVELSIACLSGTAIVTLWLWLMLEDFG